MVKFYRSKEEVDSFLNELSDDLLAEEIEYRGGLEELFGNKIEGIYERKALPYLCRHRAGDTKAAEEFLLLCAGRIV